MMMMTLTTMMVIPDGNMLLYSQIGTDFSFVPLSFVFSCFPSQNFLLLISRTKLMQQSAPHPTPVLTKQKDWLAVGTCDIAS